jgi:hypothetical protein
MSKQTDLFSDLERTSGTAVPKGFQYRENLIIEEEESSLASALGELNLKLFEFHGHLGNRRVVSFGYRYDYSRAVVEAAEEPPTVLKMLLFRIAEFAGRPAEEFEQVGIGTNHSSESSQESRFWGPRTCVFDVQLTIAGSECQSFCSRGQFTFWMGRLETYGNTVAVLHHIPNAGSKFKKWSFNSRSFQSGTGA